MKKRLYKKTLLTFTIITSVLGIIFLGYVWNSMIIYERSLVDNYITYLAESGKLTENISDDLFSVSKYEKKNAKITDGVKEVLKSKNLEYKKNKELSNEDIYAYDLKIGDKLIATVSLKCSNSYTQMAILKINEWEVSDIKTYFDKGIYNYTITVPYEYKVYINDKELEEISNTHDVEGLERLTKHIEISKNKTYEVNNLIYEPNIKILDENNKSIKFEVKDNKIVINKEFKNVSNLDEAKTYLKEDFNILKLSESWSLFLTDDLGGSWHGLFKLTPYLIEDSYMYDLAYRWSHGEDIRFVSNHRLKNPVFTNEKVENFTIYNDLAFSCEVYLEKNMVVSGKTKVDIMHDRLYFVYFEDGYKLVDMKSIEE